MPCMRSIRPGCALLGCRSFLTHPTSNLEVTTTIGRSVVLQRWRLVKELVKQASPTSSLDVPAARNWSWKYLDQCGKYYPHCDICDKFINDSSAHVLSKLHRTKAGGEALVPCITAADLNGVDVVPRDTPPPPGPPPGWMRPVDLEGAQSLQPSAPLLEVEMNEMQTTGRPAPHRNCWADMSTDDEDDGLWTTSEQPLHVGSSSASVFAPEQSSHVPSPRPTPPPASVRTEDKQPPKPKAAPVQVQALDSATRNRDGKRLREDVVEDARNVLINTGDTTAHIPLSKRLAADQWHPQHGPPLHSRDLLDNFSLVLRKLYANLPLNRIRTPTATSQHVEEFVRRYGARLCSRAKKAKMMSPDGCLSAENAFSAVHKWLMEQGCVKHKGRCIFGSVGGQNGFQWDDFYIVHEEELKMWCHEATAFWPR